MDLIYTHILGFCMLGFRARIHGRVRIREQSGWGYLNSIFKEQLGVLGVRTIGKCHGPTRGGK